MAAHRHAGSSRSTCSCEVWRRRPIYPRTDGPYKDNEKVRSAGVVYSKEFKDCVSIMVQYTYDKFGKFPATVPSIVVSLYLQTHNLYT